MGGGESIVNGVKDILKAIVVAIIGLLIWGYGIKLIGIIAMYVGIFLLFIAGVLALIGFIRIIYGVVTL